MVPVIAFTSIVLIKLVDTRQAFPPIAVSTKMSIEYISNFDFVKQTFDMIVDVERRLRDTNLPAKLDLDDIGQASNTSHIYDIRYDAIESQQIGDVQYTFKGLSITGIRTREKLTVPCHFSHSFPFDRHLCTLKLTSRKFASDHLLLTWQAPPHLLTTSMNTPSFLIDKVSSNTCDHKLSSPSAFLSTSTYVTYACLEVHLEFSRSLWLVFFRFYMPSSMAFFLAWMVFYVSRADLTSRVLLVSFSISFQIFICTFFLYSIAIPVAVVTPADVWCGLLVFQSAVIVAFMFASVLIEAQVRKYRDLCMDSRTIREDSRTRHERRAMREAMYRKENTDTKHASNYTTVIESTFRRRADNFSIWSIRLDLLARFACPVLYIILTSMYFLLYLLSHYN